MSRKNKKGGKHIDAQVYSLKEFLKAHGNFSRTHYYALKRDGLGPREMKVGGRRFISFEAAAEWRKRMERL